jgi:hypothetical protein
MRGRVLGVMLSATALFGCAEADLGTSVAPIYFVPSEPDSLVGEQWLDHPWPSDVRRRDGAVVFTPVPNPKGSALIDEYIGATEGLLDGFSTVAGGYVRFEGAIDPESLPADPIASMEQRSSVMLVDVDPSSPDFGKPHPILTSFRTEGGIYTLPNTLSWIPVPGFPLRPHTRYAFVVTHTLRSFDGGEISAHPKLDEVLGLKEASGAAVALQQDYAPVLEVLRSVGARPNIIRQLAVFTTADPTAETVAVRDHLRSNVEVPDFINREPWMVDDRDGWIEYRMWYGPSPNYQAGLLPFQTFGEGGFFNIVDGAPEVVDYFDARFSISVPDSTACPMPEGGYPIVLYAHGTGGNYRSYTSYAATLAEQCLAMMGVDQIFHGARPGADQASTDLLFFNFQNVLAARTNGRQSAIDEVQRARLFTERYAEIPAEVSHTGNAIRFDPNRVLYFGHSQGGLNGPLFLAVDDASRGGVLSGSGSVIMITLLEKTEPAPSIAELVPTLFLSLVTPEERAELDIFHPAMMLAQSLVDAIDPINYARMAVLEPRDGFMAKSMLLTEGIRPDGLGDSFTPPKGTEAQAIAMGLPPQEPLQLPYPQLAWGAPAPIAVPPEGLVGNLADGMATGALAQWPFLDGNDGHFVVFDVPEARAQVAGFLRRLSDDSRGGLPAPY